jgi:hypothetical protein
MAPGNSLASAKPARWLLRQGHLVWLVSIVNIALGFFIPGFHPLIQTISEVGHEAPRFAYTHRAADIVIGLCMCAAGLGLNMAVSGKAVFSMVATCLLGMSFISAGIWTLEDPRHLLYNLSLVVILVPVVWALELKELIHSRRFETACLTASFVNFFAFWCSYGGFVPHGVAGLVQRLWTAAIMGWFGVACHVVLNVSTQRGADPRALSTSSGRKPLAE